MFQSITISCAYECQEKGVAGKVGVGMGVGVGVCRFDAKV